MTKNKRIESETCRILITTILPEPLIVKYHLSNAACNFSSSLISGRGFTKVYSIMPLFTGGTMEKDAFTDPRFELEYDSLREKGGIWRKIAVIKEQWRIFIKIPYHSSVWFYNINILNSFIFILLKTFKRSVKLNVIVLDFTPIGKCFDISRFYLKLINAAHGRICLSNSPLFIKDNSVILPGVVTIDERVVPLIQNPAPIFLLSGSLNDAIAQTPMVLEAFSMLPECVLHITGSQNVELVKKYDNMFPNIIYHEHLDYEDYLDLLHIVTYQLSTRDISYPENQCNFPSKIIEALLHNRAVISTIHYPQLDGFKYFEVASTLNDFVKDIKRISSMHNGDLMQYVNQGYFVKIKFSAYVWNSTMATIEG